MQVIPVIPDPQLSVSKSLIEFGSSGTEDSFTIRNTGGGTLTWNILTDNQSWLRVSPTVASTTAGTDTIIVTAGRSDLDEGTYTGAITVSTNEGNVSIPVIMQVNGFNPLVGGIGIGVLVISLSGLILTLSTTVYQGSGLAIKLIGILTLRKKEQEDGTQLRIEPKGTWQLTLFGTLCGLVAGGGTLTILREAITTAPTIELVWQVVLPFTVVGFVIGKISKI